MALLQSGPLTSRRRWVSEALSVAGGAWLGFRGARPTAALAATVAAPSSAPLQRLEASLSPAQRRVVLLPFSDSRRTEADANLWATRPELGSDFYSGAQRASIQGLLKDTLSESGHARLQRQMRDDWGGWQRYRFALYATPATGQDGAARALQWQISGRHLIWRGGSGASRPLSGPLVYGHGEERSPERSLYYYQTQRARALFDTLTEAQRQAALLREAPWEDEVGIHGEAGPFSGLAVSKLDKSQKPLLRRWLGSLTELFAMPLRSSIEAYWAQHGGVDTLHVTFYREGDLRRDGVWDVWRVEGPGFVWHFRGAPHVHAFVNFGPA